MTTSRRKWPIGPIQEAVEARGGHPEQLAHKQGLSVAEARVTAARYHDGVRMGYVTLKSMDILCIDILGLHPISLYPDYYDQKYDLNVGRRKSCKRCGGVKEPGLHSLCAKCRIRLCECGCGQPTSSPKARFAHRTHSPFYQKESA